MKWISINESMEEIFCYHTYRVLCLELLDHHFYYSLDETILKRHACRFLWMTVWKRVMNALDDIGRYRKGQQQTKTTELMIVH